LAITTKAQFLAALAGAQTVIMDKGVVTGTQSVWNDVFTSAVGLGSANGAGVLAGTNTANGVVPVGGTAGFPTIRTIGAGNVAHLAGVDFGGSTMTGRIHLCDMLFKAGAYGFADSVTLASQPSFAARIPATNYAAKTELWFECVTAFTGQSDDNGHLYQPEWRCGSIDDLCDRRCPDC
jgi:hypothetical protein